MTTNRRAFLRTAALPALLAAGCRRPGASRPEPTLLNDIHSKLNPSRVAEVVPVDSLARLQEALQQADRRGLQVSMAGGRHAMGGQQFGEGTLHLDTRPLRRVLDFDHARGVIEVEAGIQWPDLVSEYLQAQDGRSPQWGIAQKQTGADRLAIGGAVAANAHGRGLAMKPIVADVESFTLVDATGERHTCSREHNAELFGLAIGGYGLFGVIDTVRLRLVPRRKVERVVALASTNGLMQTFEERIATGHLYGDFQFSVDAASDGFLHDGVLSCYRPAADEAPIPSDQGELGDEEWDKLVYLAHADEAEAFRLYSRYYLSTSGQIYWSDTQQLGFYADDYHQALDTHLGARVPGSEMITELYVPRDRLVDFLQAAARWLRESDAEVIYGTVRLIEQDDESFLAWAKARFACIVLNLHVDHSSEGLERAQRQFRGLIDLARERDGSFFLTYHRWATRAQIEACYPQMPELLRLKRTYDPSERFQSDWYRHMCGLFA